MVDDGIMKVMGEQGQKQERVPYPPEPFEAVTPPGGGEAGGISASVLKCPLSAEHVRVIASSVKRRRKIKRAASVASFNGWSAAVFAAISLPFGFWSMTALVIGVGLGVIAFNEFYGRRMLQRMDLRGPVLLGWNQIGFALLLLCYCAWSVYSMVMNPSTVSDQLGALPPEMASMVGSIEEMTLMLTYLTYGTVAMVSLIIFGGNAWYYFSRRKWMKSYLNETPRWVVELGTMMGS